jgi:nucleotide-binding universal stress UspA family protein
MASRCDANRSKERAMAIKDILVHVDSTPSSDTRLSIAVDLAARNDAHLAGLHVRPNYYIPPAADFPLPQSYFDEQDRESDANATEARRRFDAALARANISSEWREAYGFPSDIVRQHARYADLTIVGQRNPDANGQSQDLPDGVLLTTGRPVLIVPSSLSVKSFARDVIVAWDDGVPATRALNDAIPLMADDASVEVLAVNPKDTGEHGPIPCADICLHLARHGIEAAARSLTVHDVDEAEVIVTQALEGRCDLLIMGAYGHSRMREFVFGGVTDYVLRNATMPVLMSH